MPNNPILFSLKEHRALTRDTWQQFTSAAHAHEHSIAGIFRAFVLYYIANGLGPAAGHYSKGESHPPPG